MSHLPDIPVHLTSTPNVTKSKPLPEPDSTRPSSDLSSIGPSQSASQVNLLPPPIPLNYNRFLDPGPSQQYHTPPASSHSHSQPDISQPQINIPPAHAISDDNSMPLATYTHDGNGGYAHRRVLERRITEEDIHLRSQDDLNLTGETSASENENEGLATGKLSVVENPRFAPANGSVDGSGGTPEKKKFSLRQEANGDAHSSSPLKDAEKDKEKHGKSFFGSIRGLFGSRSKDKEHERPFERENSVDSRDAHPRSPLGGLFPKRNQSYTAVGHSPSKKWDMRTDRNIRSLQKAGSDDEHDGTSNPRPPVNISPVVMRDIIEESGPGRYRGRVGRKRVASDVGVTGKASVPTHENGSSSNVGGTGRRLKKARASSVQVETRVRASPTSMELSSPPQPEPKERIVRPGDSGGESEKEKEKANVKRNGSSVRRAEEWVGGQHKQRALESSKDDIVTSTELPRKAKAVGRSATLAAIPVSSGSSAAKGNAAAAKLTPTMPANKGSASDSEASPIGRKKSLKKTHPVASVPAIVLPAGGDSPSGTLSAGANLSRNSSIISAASAPPLNALGQGMTVASVARRASAGVNYKPAGADARSAERKGSLSIHLAPPHASLMSIVEDVARGNRDAWSQNQEEKLRILKNSGGAQKRVVDLGVVKAPPRMGRQDILNLQMAKPAPPLRKMIDVPTAPGSVVDMLRAHGPQGDGAQGKHIDGLPSSTSTSEIMKGEGASKISSRPAKVPLRSAMKNPSRTPSPLPQQNSHRRSASSSGASISKPTPELYSVVAPSPITPRTMSGLLGSPLSQSVTLAPVHQVPAPAPSHLNPLPPPVSSNPLPWEDGANQEENDHDDEDSSSISSYETGQERFSDDEDTEREAPFHVESVSVQPPRAETRVAVAETHHSTVQHVDESNNGYFSPQRSRQSLSTASPKQPDDGRTLGQGNIPLRVGVRGSGSDISSSAGSNVVNPNQTPRRRKSVRVSLKPTFSPTPPAIDDDDEEDVRKARAPWVWKQEAPLPLSSPPPRSLPPPKQNGNADAVDMWADSSEEDEEYQKAKRMLIRAAKKEKKAKS